MTEDVFLFNYVLIDQMCLNTFSIIKWLFESNLFFESVTSFNLTLSVQENNHVSNYSFSVCFLLMPSHSLWMVKGHNQRIKSVIESLHLKLTETESEL